MRSPTCSEPDLRNAAASVVARVTSYAASLQYRLIDPHEGCRSRGTMLSDPPKPVGGTQLEASNAMLAEDTEEDNLSVAQLEDLHAPEREDEYEGVPPTSRWMLDPPQQVRLSDRLSNRSKRVAL